MTNPAHTAEAEAHALLLVRECDVFCRYLVGRGASAFIAQKYAEAHARDARYRCASAFDRVLVRLAGASPLVAQWADSYAGIAARASLLRKKLVLLVAILESSAPEHGFNDGIADTPAAVVILRLAGRGLLFAVRLAFGMVLIGPVHFVLAVTRSAGERA